MALTRLPTDAVTDSSITGAKLNADIISSQTALATQPADADEFIISDSGVIKRLDYSLIKATSFTTLGYSSVYMNGDTAISGNSHIQPSEGLTIYVQSPALSGRVDDITDGNIRMDKTGWYMCLYQSSSISSSGNDVWHPKIVTYNGSSEDGKAYGSVYNVASSQPTTQTIVAIVDVDNVDDVKFRMGYGSASNITLYGTGQSVTAMHFIRLGDT